MDAEAVALGEEDADDEAIGVGVDGVGLAGDDALVAYLIGPQGKLIAWLVLGFHGVVGDAVPECLFYQGCAHCAVFDLPVLLHLDEDVDIWLTYECGGYDGGAMLVGVVGNVFYGGLLCCAEGVDATAENVVVVA